jgi:hypothetical protein
MKHHEFQSKFANLPIKKRGVMLNFVKYGPKTLSDLYREIKANRAVLLPLLTREAELLRIAEEGFKSLANPKDI